MEVDTMHHEEVIAMDRDPALAVVDSPGLLIARPPAERLAPDFDATTALHLPDADADRSALDADATVPINAETIYTSSAPRVARRRTRKALVMLIAMLAALIALVALLGGGFTRSSPQANMTTDPGGTHRSLLGQIQSSLSSILPISPRATATLAPSPVPVTMLAPDPPLTATTVPPALATPPDATTLPAASAPSPDAVTLPAAPATTTATAPSATGTPAKIAPPASLVAPPAPPAKSELAVPTNGRQLRHRRRTLRPRQLTRSCQRPPSCRLTWPRQLTQSRPHRS